MAVADEATGKVNSVKGSMLYENDTAVALLEDNPALTTQEVCDALSEEGTLEPLYNLLTYIQTGLAIHFPEIKFRMSKFEKIPWRAEGVFRLLDTTIPFDPMRPRFAEQTSLKAAQALAEENTEKASGEAV